MFDRISTIASGACYITLFMLLFGAMFFAMLPSTDSWLLVVAALILASPLMALIGGLVIGPISAVIGIAIGAIACGVAALIRFMRS